MSVYIFKASPSHVDRPPTPFVCFFFLPHNFNPRKHKLPSFDIHCWAKTSRSRSFSLAARPGLTSTKLTMSARYWLSRLHELLTPIAVIEHRFRFIPLLGCLTILFNDAEFFFKQTAMFRAIESLYCIEYYTEIGDVETAALGRSIPESSCKDEWIEQRVAKTYGWIMFFRILPCIFTAIPLGYLADRAGRRLVLCLHKIGTIFFVATEILVCMLSSHPSSMS